MSLDPVDLGDLAQVVGVSAAAVALLMLGTYAVARRQRRVAVVDTTWGLFFVLVAVVAATLGDGDLVRRLVLAAMVGVWGSRLAWHLIRRNAGKGEDPRYAELLESAEGDGWGYALTHVFVLQAAAAWFVALPVQVNATLADPLGVVGYLGVAVWLLGLVFESVGDAQLRAFKADARNKGAVMDRGLWAWTRHPNYFGDACVWFGTFLVAAEHWPGVLTVASPVAMTYVLVFGTGARLLERSMMRRPGYPEYAERTSFFVPLPPRRR